MVHQEEVPPEGIGDPGGHGPGDEQTEDNVADHGGPLHDEDVRDRGERGHRTQPAPEAAFFLDGHVHGGVALHGAGAPNVGLGSGRLKKALTQKEAEEDGQQHDHDGAADELGQGELPSDEQGQDDAQLDDQVGRGDLEGHGGREARPLPEQRPGQGHRRVGAR